MYRCCTITVLDHLYDIFYLICLLDHCVDATVLQTTRTTISLKQETSGLVVALADASVPLVVVT